MSKYFSFSRIGCISFTLLVLIDVVCCITRDLMICNPEKSLILKNERKLRRGVQSSSTPFGDEDNLEASGLVARRDGLIMYVIFDNTYEIGVFCTDRAINLGNCTNRLLDWPDKTMNRIKSEFEGIAYSALSDTFFIVQETIRSPFQPQEYISNIFEVEITPDIFSQPVRIVESCPVFWKFNSTSKGFEGLEFITHKRTEKSFLLALCEGNNCDIAIMDETNTVVNLGEGRVIVLEKEYSVEMSCRWIPVGVIHLPRNLEFLDYSALSSYTHDGSTYVAITSQESSQLWIGVLEELDESPYFSISSKNEQEIYNFPPYLINGNRCETQYCNIEGVHWLNENELLFVSDLAKRVSEDSMCTRKDESVHHFILPDRNLSLKRAPSIFFIIYIVSIALSYIRY